MFSFLSTGPDEDSYCAAKPGVPLRDVNEIVGGKIDDKKLLFARRYIEGGKWDIVEERKPGRIKKRHLKFSRVATNLTGREAIAKMKEILEARKIPATTILPVATPERNRENSMTLIEVEARLAAGEKFRPASAQTAARETRTSANPVAGRSVNYMYGPELLQGD